MDEYSAVPSRTARARTSDGFEVALQRPRAVGRGCTHVAEESGRRCQRGRHPSTPVVVQDRRDREYTLLDENQTPSTHGVNECLVSEPQPDELAPRDAIELSAGERRKLSVPHAP